MFNAFDEVIDMLLMENKEKAYQHATILNAILGNTINICEQYFVEGEKKGMSLKTYYRVGEAEPSEKIEHFLYAFDSPKAIKFKRKEFKNFYKYSAEMFMMKVYIKIYKVVIHNYRENKNIILLKYKIHTQNEQEYKSIVVNQEAGSKLPDPLFENILNRFKPFFADMISDILLKGE